MSENNYLFDKYLDILGLQRSAADFDLLSKIIKGQIIKIPFENISKLLYGKQGLCSIPALEVYLDGISNYNLGGTCYANNYYMSCLLKNLGYNARLCGADMREPDVHIAVIVTLDQTEYILDAGYAAPFLEPLNRNLPEPKIFAIGKEEYVVYPKDDIGRTKIEEYYDSKLIHWYTLKPEARTFKEFSEVINKSFAPDATFMNAVRISKFEENYSLVLKNLSLTENKGRESVNTKILRKDLSEVILQKFGVPAEITEKASNHLQDLKEY